MRIIFGLLPLLASVCLAACSSGEKPASAVGGNESGQTGPLALTPQQPSSQQLSSRTVAMPLDQDEVSKAIENLRIAKKKSEGPFEQAGADLNSDGKAEALVLLTGRDWCSPQGCTLVVFEASEGGYKPISQTVGVKPPVAVAAGTTSGWRDLIVKTGGFKIVRLQFTAGGYPVNAAIQPDGSADVALSEVLIQPPAAQASVIPPNAGRQ